MTPPLGFSAGAGAEAEYIIVKADTLDVAPIADRLLAEAGGDGGDVDRGRTGWSNEFALHLVELKTSGPVRPVGDMAGMIHAEALEANRLLAPMGARLMPGGAHPWMDPATELVRWPHGNAEIYGAYDRIFGSRQHGYANVQSVHINLPFKDDDEFGRVCAAVRLALPLIPALAAASPFLDGRRAPALDARMTAYMANSAAVPQVAGEIIPEPVFSMGEYHDMILAPLYKAIAPHDPDGILAYEWLNARGAIPRFGRSALEIRVMDVQENPFMDMAVAAVVYGVVNAMVEERWTAYQAQKQWGTARLKRILMETIVHGEKALITDTDYIEAFNIPPRGPMTAGELWRWIIADPAACGEIGPREAAALETILAHGTLASRLVRAAGPRPDRAKLAQVYGALCGRLADGTAFIPAP